MKLTKSKLSQIVSEELSRYESRGSMSENKETKLRSFIKENLRSLLKENFDYSVRSLGKIFYRSLEVNSDHSAKRDALDAIGLIEDHLNLRGREPLAVTGWDMITFSDESANVYNKLIDDFNTENGLLVGKEYQLEIGKLDTIRTAFLQDLAGNPDEDIWLFNIKSKRKVTEYIKERLQS